MKALSIRQPWAWLILHAGKDIENRSWPTRLRGPVLVHAAKGMTRAEYENCLSFCKYVSRVRGFPSGLQLPSFGALPRGGFVGTVDITDCVDESRSPWFVGPFGFVLLDPRPLPFTPYRGQLGFFEVPDEAVKAER